MTMAAGARNGAVNGGPRPDTSLAAMASLQLASSV